MVMSTMEELYTEGKKEGRIEGKKEGIKEGIKEGEKKGKIEGKIEFLLKVLRTRFKRVPALTEKAVRAYKDMVALESLLEHALVCATLAEFERDLVHL
jgi:flagellar biosynthesis/type III secretory pathway protein FliH